MFNRRVIQVLALAAMVVTMAGGCKSKTPPIDPGSQDITGIGPGSDVGVGDVGMMGGERLPAEGDRTMFAPVMFDYDSSQVSQTERAKVEAVAQYMRGKPNVGVVVEGHCDERGSAEYNLSLGDRRALAVRAYLIGLGIEAERVQTKSFGEEQPAAMGHDEESWRQNRRGVFNMVNL